jgi:hypothetical protein
MFKYLLLSLGLPGRVLKDAAAMAALLLCLNLAFLSTNRE